MLKIEYVEQLDKVLGEMIGVEFDKHSTTNGIDCNYLPFIFVAKDNNEAVGIITGQAVYGEVRIDNFIVSEQHRDKHIGSKLIETVERYYRDKGCAYMEVTTHDFQAPKFYQKHGFKVDFIRENKENPKLNKYFLIKYF